jgi:hypothetical protein
MTAIARIEVVGAPADGKWVIGTSYHLRIEELSALGHVISPRNPAHAEHGWLNPNWNCPNTYGLLHPILDAAGTGEWAATYTPHKVGSDPLEATLTALSDHIFQSHPLVTHNIRG